MTCSVESLDKTGLDKIVLALFICQIVIIVSSVLGCIDNGNAVL